MDIYAAAGDTWGISGPTFLGVYIVVAAVVLFGTILHRRHVFGGTPDPRYADINPQQAAYLNGGAKLAIYAALSALRNAEAIGASDDRRLRQTGRLLAGATPLDQAVYNAAGNRLRTRDLAADTWVAEAVRGLRGDLERAGLLTTVEQRRAARGGPLVLLGLFALGVFRLAAGIANGKPVILLLITLALLGAFTAVLLVRSARRTRAGDAALLSLRRANRHLSLSERPAWQTYGPLGAGMGVALYGTTSLWAGDPSFAAGADVERHYAGAGGFGYAGSSGGTDFGGGGGGDAGGGGGGCGGGGCGG